MPDRPLVERIEILEHNVEVLNELRQLPERMTALETQFLHLRTEMAAEFSAMRAELRAEIREGDDSLRANIRVLHEADEAIRAEMHAMRADLRSEIREGDGDTRRYMRVLHEEVLSRFALLEEGLDRGRRRPRR